MEHYKIGTLELKNRFLLAPMLEPNDIAFRLLCKEAGCGLTFSGMTNPLSEDRQFLDDKPILQLFTSSNEGVKLFIEKYDEFVSGWDFNLGCPSKLSRRLGHGAFLQKDLDSINAILRDIRASTKKACVVKLRKSPHTISIAKLAELIGFDAVIIHSRTISEGYSGEPDYEFALELKRNLKIPVVYSGNVGLKNYEKILEDFDFVMIGRDAIGNPNIFAELLGKTSKILFSDYLMLAKKYGLYYRQIKFQAMNFTKGANNAKDLRRELIKAKNIIDVEKVYSLFSNKP